MNDEVAAAFFKSSSISLIRPRAHPAQPQASRGRSAEYRRAPCPVERTNTGALYTRDEMKMIGIAYGLPNISRNCKTRERSI